MTAIEKERTIIIDDIVISLSEDKYVELMGVLYPGFVYGEDFSSTMHRWCVSRLNSYIRCQITEAGLNCKVFSAPFGVFIDDDNYFDPDLSIICDKNKLSDRGCEGAPDWVIEITNPTTQNDDYMNKLFKYRSAGVRLYWVVDPEKQTVNVWDYEHEEFAQYSFSDSVPVSICEGFVMRLDDIL